MVNVVKMMNVYGSMNQEYTAWLNMGNFSFLFFFFMSTLYRQHNSNVLKGPSELLLLLFC